MAEFEKFTHRGRCDICETDVIFTSYHHWFRDHFLCSGCGSIPRERAMMRVIKEFAPDFADLAIHESSPAGRVSVRLAEECGGYTFSHYTPEVPLGDFISDLGCSNQDVESLTFDDSSFDLFVSQDVLEHVFDPVAAFKEIARVLKPGGCHIFTVPLVNGARSSERRAFRSESGEIIHLVDHVFHDNPISPEGSLVTIDWGYDIAGLIMQTTGMPTVIVRIDNIDAGIRADLVEVLVTHKSGVLNLGQVARPAP